MAEIRAAEAPLLASLPEGALMRRAAYGLAVQCAGLLGRVYGAQVGLLAGSGDNGGDALHAGAYLARRGAGVSALLLSPDRAHPGGLAALLAAGGRVVDALPPAALVMDGIVGIGGSGGLRPEAAEVVASVSAPIVAVDVPSGVDADTGAVRGAAVHADVTVTFGGLKPGLLVGAGREHAGDVRVVDIGLSLPPPPVRVLEAADVAAVVPVPGARSDKYTRGVVGVAAGSAEYPGAGVLCTGSAIRSGAGMVRYAGTAAEHVRSRWPEAIVTDGGPSSAGRVQSWVVGPGIGTDAAAAALLREVLATDVPVLVDADGLTLVAKDPAPVRDREAPTVLTPHDREFERIFGPIGDDRIGATRRAAADLGATVLLKGNATVVSSPSGAVHVNPTGTSWLATAGSGDVLSGLGGTLLAGGLDATSAAAAAAYLHGLAGRIASAGAPTTAAAVLNALPPAFRSVLRLRRS